MKTSAEPPGSPPPPDYPEIKARAEEHRFPLLKPSAGRVLRLMTRLHKPLRVADVGSGFGGSAIWMAPGMAQEGELWLLDHRQANLDRATGYIQKERPDLNVFHLAGNILTTIAGLPHSFNLIFVDCDGMSYNSLLNDLLARLAPGGLLIFDNLFVGGRLLQPDGRKQKALASMQEVLRRVEELPHLEVSSILNDDGLLVIHCLDSVDC